MGIFVYLLSGFSGAGIVLVVLGCAYRGLTGRFVLLHVRPHVCFILVLILISVFLR